MLVGSIVYLFVHVCAGGYPSFIILFLEYSDYGACSWAPELIRDFRLGGFRENPCSQIDNLPLPDLSRTEICGLVWNIQS